MARKSRVRRRIKARHTRRRQVTGGEGGYLTDVQFNKQANSFSSIGFNIVLRFNSGNVYYGDINVGTYKSPLKEGSYTIYKIEPSQRLYGKPFNNHNTPVIIHSQTKDSHIKTPKSNYFSKLTKLVTPR